MKYQITILLLILRLGCSGLLAANAEPGRSFGNLDGLTLEQALEMAEGLQPELAEARAAVQAAEGRARQAGAIPNPEVILGAQQIPFNGPDEKEYVAGVGQTLPLGGRLSRAREAELLDREVIARGLEVKRRDVRRRVHSAFATALYQEKAYDAQTGIMENAAKAVATTRARIAAGDALREDLARVEMEMARARVELQKAESLREQARVALVTAIGDVTLSVKSLAGALDATFEIPTLESLAANLASQPESALAAADVRARYARVDAAKAERVPDVKVEVLYHRLEATRSDTLDVGLSIPLPLFNRNQGKLREARAEAAAAEARARATQNELGARLREAHLQLSTALASSAALKKDILPRAETVLKGTEARYAAGDISLSEVLPVRRDWAVVQLSYLESLRGVMQAWAELKSLSN
jgi:cobalt-zinc-cadmium efflux system outer membrane protein